MSSLSTNTCLVPSASGEGEGERIGMDIVRSQGLTKRSSIKHQFGRNSYNSPATGEKKWKRGIPKDL